MLIIDLLTQQNCFVAWVWLVEVVNNFYKPHGVLNLLFFAYLGFWNTIHGLYFVNDKIRNILIMWHWWSIYIICICYLGHSICAFEPKSSITIRYATILKSALDNMLNLDIDIVDTISLKWKYVLRIHKFVHMGVQSKAPKHIENGHHKDKIILQRDWTIWLKYKHSRFNNLTQTRRVGVDS